ncbi:MAG: hypothetical protein LBD22_01060, partial [Spirochaetaceae bacterium]|nr:hypothetical protein [Spirochaetaceae bacterium]
MAYVKKSRKTVIEGETGEETEQPLFENGDEAGQEEQAMQGEESDAGEGAAAPGTESGTFDGERHQSRVVVRPRPRQTRERSSYDDGDRQQRGGHQSRRGGGGYERQGGGGHYGGGGAYNNNAYASGINQAGMSSGFNLNSVSYAQGPLPELPKLSSMPDLYGRPEPRGDDGGVTRLSINELTRMSMIDLRE